MSKRLRPSGAVYRRLKANREDKLTKYAGCIIYVCKQSRKNRKSNDEKSGDKQKKQDS